MLLAIKLVVSYSMSPKEYARKYYCKTCEREQERKDVKEGPEHDEIVLTCGHTLRGYTREAIDMIEASDHGNAYVTISFQTDKDRLKAFYELLLSKSEFRRITEDQFVVSNKGSMLLQKKNINYKITGYPEKLPDVSNSSIRDEVKRIRAENPDLYEALAKDDPSLIK
jgi:6-phosphofructokinase